MRAALRARLIPPQQQLFTALEPSSYRPMLIGVVVADVFAFREALGLSAVLRGDALDHLANLRPPGSAPQWLRAPAGKRVFATGFGVDLPPVSMYAEALRAAGYEVFSYDYCQNQQYGLSNCPTETVGAYFATAGHLLVGLRGRSAADSARESAAAPASPADRAGAVLITRPRAPPSVKPRRPISRRSRSRRVLSFQAAEGSTEGVLTNDG
jgi:hypothetical protein